MTALTTGAVAKSPALRACVPHDATQKPKVEGKEQRERESPPVALHTGEHGHEDDPHCDKQAQDNHLSIVLTRPPDSEAAALFVWSHSRDASYAVRQPSRGHNRVGRPDTPVRVPLDPQFGKPK